MLLTYISSEMVVLCHVFLGVVTVGVEEHNQSVWSKGKQIECCKPLPVKRIFVSNNSFGKILSWSLLCICL